VSPGKYVAELPTEPNKHVRHVEVQLQADSYRDVISQEGCEDMQEHLPEFTHAQLRLILEMTANRCAEELNVAVGCLEEVVSKVLVDCQQSAGDVSAPAYSRTDVTRIVATFVEKGAARIRSDSSREASSASVPEQFHSQHPAQDADTEVVYSEPKRPPSSYFLFAAEQKAKVAAHECDGQTLAKRITRGWQELDKSVRTAYEEQAAQMTRKYEQQVADYRRYGHYRRGNGEKIVRAGQPGPL